MFLVRIQAAPLFLPHLFIRMIEIKTEKIELPDGTVHYFDPKDSTLSFAVREIGGQQIVVKIGTFEKVSNWVRSLGNKAIGIRVQPDKPSEDAS